MFAETTSSVADRLVDTVVKASTTRVAVVVVGWLLSVPATCEYLRDGSAQTVLSAATLR